VEGEILDKQSRESSGYNSIADAILHHIGIIIFVASVILDQLGMFPKNMWLSLFASFAGIWGIVEMISSKFRTISAIGLIMAFALSMFGSEGGNVLRGY
jgi:hypothetical protein